MNKNITTTPKRKNASYLMFVFLFTMSGIVYTQDIHKEVPDDSYIPVDRESMEKGPAYNVRGGDFFTSQVNVDGNGLDILGDAANEPSIAVDPTDPDRIVIGWRQFDTVNSNFRQAGYGYSTDGGLTWTFPGSIDPGQFHSDPVLDFDADGNFYYNSLTGNNFACEVYRITDGGVVWQGPVAAFGGDKQWMRIDRTNGIGAGNNYSNWNLTFSVCSPGDFTRSIDGALNFEDCEPVSGAPRWGTLAVDADGALYIVGTSASGLILIKSTTAQDPNFPVTFDFISPVDLDGQLSIGGSVNPQGLLGQLWVDVDISGGPGHGNVYVLASVDRDSNNDPGDVMFAKSTDGGLTFSPPVKINTDTGTDNYQWFGTMSVAPNGRIDVVWLDTRLAPAGTNDSALYFSFSEDQGETWSDNQRISMVFDPNIGYPQQNKMGDYFDMVSDNEGAHLAWANTINGGQDVYYTHIPPLEDILGINEISESNFKILNYPNPFSDETTIEFFIKNEEHVKIEVFDLQGKNLGTLLDKTVYGNYRLTWDGRNSGGQKLSTGLYFISIQAGSNTSLLKVVLK